MDAGDEYHGHQPDDPIEETRPNPLQLWPELTAWPGVPVALDADRDNFGSSPVSRPVLSPKASTFAPIRSSIAT